MKYLYSRNVNEKYQCQSTILYNMEAFILHILNIFFQQENNKERDQKESELVEELNQARISLKEKEKEAEGLRVGFPSNTLRETA